MLARTIPPVALLSALVCPPSVSAQVPERDSDNGSKTLVVGGSEVAPAGGLIGTEEENSINVCGVAAGGIALLALPAVIRFGRRNGNREKG